MKILITAVAASVFGMMLAMFASVHYLIPQAGSAHDLAVSTKQMAKLQNEIDRLTANQKQLFEQLQSTSSPVEAPAGLADSEQAKAVQKMPSVRPVDTATDEKEELEHYKAERAELFQLAEDQFYSEGYDSGWATEMQTSLVEVENRLHSMNFLDTQIVNQECRSATCRVEFLHGENSQDLFPGLLAAKGTRQLVLQRVSDDYGDRTIALYQR